ncbi:hypothetical protein [Motiliproteus sp. MSK22-1]|uniref:hypothetical protein n=1 Tax=Motiliproteus sp. MSK22-1 TaxID=1897630 RepID=UPI0009756611|nr:hypothetical protein [Motiliproteus sp. MSK22-1]OMH29066.1 hypothetical protein BGP75_20130 [Motiliproteus sp. MSK22-1]
MKMTGLSFDNIPPLSVPFRFFFTAPLFGILAGVLIMIVDDLWISRWHPALLGFTHLLTLGVMAMVMLGALFQLMPVISSQPVPGARHIAPWVHLLLSAGTLSLVAGFMAPMSTVILTAGIILLILGFVTFLGPLLLGLIRVGQGGDSIHSIRLAIGALIIALIIGGSRALSYAFPETWTALAGFANYHIGWGLGGWVVLLVMGVSFQVIPMFHVAPNFRRSVSLGLTSLLFLSLLIISIAPAGSALLKAAMLAAIALIITYSLYTLNLIRQRKRRISDPTIHFWQLGLSALVIACLVLSALLFGKDSFSGLEGKLQILSGLLFGYGFAISIIEGMLQKIIPFLIYMHLQRDCMKNPQAFASLPNMKTLIPTKVSRRQFQLHLSALVLVSASLFLPVPAWLSGAAIVVDFSWLLYALLKAQRVYSHTRQSINVCA